MGQPDHVASAMLWKDIREPDAWDCPSDREHNQGYCISLLQALNTAAEGQWSDPSTCDEPAQGFVENLRESPHPHDQATFIRTKRSAAALDDGGDDLKSSERDYKNSKFSHHRTSIDHMQQHQPFPSRESYFQSDKSERTDCTEKEVPVATTSVATSGNDDIEWKRIQIVDLCTRIVLSRPESLDLFDPLFKDVANASLTLGKAGLDLVLECLQSMYSEQYRLEVLVEALKAIVAFKPTQLEVVRSYLKVMRPQGRPEMQAYLTEMLAIRWQIHRMHRSCP
jgi:hypothetical protein